MLLWLYRNRDIVIWAWTIAKPGRPRARLVSSLISSDARHSERNQRGKRTYRLGVLSPGRKGREAKRPHAPLGGRFARRQ